MWFRLFESINPGRNAIQLPGGNSLASLDHHSTKIPMNDVGEVLHTEIVLLSCLFISGTRSNAYNTSIAISTGPPSHLSRLRQPDRMDPCRE